MALKGTTKIELTNVHTGQKEVVEHHNMITNVLSDMNKRIYGFNNINPFIYTYARQFLGPDDPFWKAMFQGIILFEDALSDNADEYIFPAGNNVTACGNVGRVKTSDMTDKTMSVLGNYNVDESVIKDGMVKMVYDFPTSQGNGTISSVALCNHLLSRSLYNHDVNMSVVNIDNVSTAYTTERFFMKNIALAGNYVSKDGSNYTFTFYDDNVDGCVIKLSSRVGANNPLRRSVKTLTVDLGADSYSVCGNIPDKNIIILNSGTSYKFVRLTDGNVYGRNAPSGYDAVCAVDGYFICAKKLDSTYNYSIFSDAGNEIKANAFSYGSLLSCKNGLFSNRYALFSDGGLRILVDLVSGGATKFYNGYSIGNNNEEIFCNILHSFSVTGAYFTYGFSTWQPWLTTKNNLDSPVTKTVDKMMKVTYTLTEA